MERGTLAERLAPLDINARTCRPRMDNGITLRVTMVRPGPVPSVEVGAYEYVGPFSPRWVRRSSSARSSAASRPAASDPGQSVRRHADLGHNGCERTRR